MKLNLSVAETILIIIIILTTGIGSCSKYIELKEYQKKTELSEGEG